MYPPVLLGLSFVAYLLGAARTTGPTTHSYVLMPVAFLIDSSGLVHRISYSIIGLSCLVLAATLASFLLSTRKAARFHWPLFAVNICTAVAGLVSLFTGAVGPRLYASVADKTPLVLAVLFLVVACVLPLLLPTLISKSREVEISSTVPQANESRFQAVAEDSDDAIMLLDALRSPDGRIEDFLFTYLNANAEKIILKRTARWWGRGSHGCCRSAAMASCLSSSGR